MNLDRFDYYLVGAVAFAALWIIYATRPGMKIPHWLVFVIACLAWPLSLGFVLWNIGRGIFLGLTGGRRPWR